TKANGQNVHQGMPQVLAPPPGVGDSRQRLRQRRSFVGRHRSSSLTTRSGSVLRIPAERGKRKWLSHRHLKCAHRALLPEPQRAETRPLLRDCVDARLEAVQPGMMAPALACSEDLQYRLWAQAVIAGEKNPTPIGRLFIQSLNDVIDMHAKRVI